MQKLPDWLPAEVASHVQKLLKTGGLGVTERTLRRLAFDQEMAKVWETLQPLSGGSRRLIDYLEYVRMHRAVMGWPTDFLDVPGDAVQRKVFKKVATSCEAMLNTLAKLSDDQDPQRGWGLLEQAIGRNELRAASEGDDDKLLAVANIRAQLQEIKQTSNVVEILETIKLAASLAADAPDMNLPKKRNAKRPDIACLARDLSSHVQTHFHKPLHEVVAITVNVGLHLDKFQIDADYVRKLKRS